MSPVCRSGGRWRDRRADAQQEPRYIPRSNPRVRSCEGEGRSRTTSVEQSVWRARSAGGGAAGSVARMSVTRGEASGRRPARAGTSTRFETRIRWTAQGCSCSGETPFIGGRRRKHENPVPEQAGNVRDVDSGQEERTGGRTAAGRAGSFNPEEQRSSRFRSYGPPLREERLRSIRAII